MCVVHGEDIKMFFDELGDFGRLPLNMFKITTML
jgi:hypothetical protein